MLHNITKLHISLFPSACLVPDALCAPGTSRDIGAGIQYLLHNQTIHVTLYHTQTCKATFIT